MPPTHDLKIERVPVGELRTYHRNPRRGDTTLIARSLTVNGQYKPLVVNRGTHTGRPNEVLAGNHTVIAMRDLGQEHADVSYIDVDDDQAARIVAVDNRSSDAATYDDRLLLELLADLPDLDGTGYEPGDLAELERLLADDQASGGDNAGTGGTEARRTLAERFGVPPMTVLDARQGYWQDRKRAWITLGITSVEGRHPGLTGGMVNVAEAHAALGGRETQQRGWESGTSVFDPVLAELLIRWYSAPGQRILDPFAGSSKAPTNQR